ncbi:hypothetical protein Ancab_014907 [Ancistrocladus abbreviatus]
MGQQQQGWLPKVQLEMRKKVDKAVETAILSKEVQESQRSSKDGGYAKPCAEKKQCKWADLVEQEEPTSLITTEHACPKEWSEVVVLAADAMDPYTVDMSEASIEVQ